MKTKIMTVLVGILGLAVMVGMAWAQSVPQLINYQGRLTNAAGQPPADGTTVDLSFAFYASDTGPTPLFLTVLQEDVVVTSGIYNVLIGSGTVTPGTEPNLSAVFQNHQEVWMGVKVDTDNEMTPRARITSVPYAMSIDMTIIGDFIQKQDWDQDGFLKEGNTVDCNDGNADIHPGAPELCDGLDNQCPGETGYGTVDEWCNCSDGDGDGRGLDCALGNDCNDNNQNAWDTCSTCNDDDSDSWFELCNTYNGIDGPDCDDSLADVYPGAPELCDSIDNQCPGDGGYGLIDEGVTITYYRDYDDDGFGNPLNTAQACSLPAGYVTNSTDCDDYDVDNYLSCATCLDNDGDNWFDGCDAYTTRSGPDCDDADENNWLSCAACTDADGDGISGTGCDVNADCNDGSLVVYPGAPELCDSIDNQCPGDGGYGLIDEGVTITYYRDYDDDGFGNPLNTAQACSSPAGYVANSTDCDDTNQNAWSTCGTCDDDDLDSYYELCNQYLGINGPDQCDGDENNWTASGCANCQDGDLDTYYADCDAYATIDGPDCNDSEITVYPGAPELCDSIDNQCPGDPGYGQIDEGGVCATPPGMAHIAMGCFDMGDAFSEGNSDELPVHFVCITSDFYMDVHEVTNSEYKACVDASGCTAPAGSGSATRGSYYGNPTYNNFPVILVSWNQATAYCTWAGKRLPTEAEWEYAARGGIDGMRYPWGDSISGTDANYNNSGDPWDNDTSQVEYYAANGYGLYDMSGNVWEWVNDRYLGTYYSVSPTNDPPGPESGPYRVSRGGSWLFNTFYLRASHRLYNEPTGRNSDIGIRCAGD